MLLKFAHVVLLTFPSASWLHTLQIDFGQSPNITKWLEPDYYAPVWYLDPDPGSSPKDNLKLAGGWLGVAHCNEQVLVTGFHPCMQYCLTTVRPR